VKQAAAFEVVSIALTSLSLAGSIWNYTRTRQEIHDLTNFFFLFLPFLFSFNSFHGSVYCGMIGILHLILLCYESESTNTRAVAG
jgi:hypothetical protein